jgi:8-oxo-dGTP diphosphatase
MTQPDRQPAAVAVIVKHGCVLLVHRRADDGTPPWVLPGGKLEPGETPEAATVREVLEETGLTVTPRRALGERIHPATGKHLVYVACDVTAGTAHVADTDELDAVEWVPIGELAAYVPGGFYGPVRQHLDAGGSAPCESPHTALRPETWPPAAM